jgi:DNA-binding LytR/AlgR family response regulator
VVGQAGLGRALLILALANAIPVLTSLSLSAAATNLRVKRGGDYYLISRTLGHLVTRTEDWEDARIRLLCMCQSDKLVETTEMLRNILQEIRIEVEAVVLEQTTAEAMLQHSTDASLVFLPLRLRGDQPMWPFDEPLDATLEPLPAVVLVLAAEDLDLDAEPEEGTAAEVAHLLDALSDAERLAELTARDAREAEAATQKISAELEAEITKGGDPESIEKLKLQLQQLEADEEKARIRAARTAAKAQAAKREATALGLLETDAEHEDGDRKS